MLYPFIAIYFSCFFLLRHWNEGNVYLYRILKISNSVDIYSVAFFGLLGVVAGCVRIWSYYYMDEEKNYSRFFSLLARFIACMVLLIFFSNLYITLIGWDGLGLTSFLLVVYYKNRKSLGSGMITALTNRVGDCLLICVLGFCFFKSHLLSLVLLLGLSITKSAQFPFSSWLPAAIAAPTPVRALVHSSTLVTAGVYVLIRYCFLDQNTILFIGRVTILVAGLRACSERDLKKVIALRTLSQLGVMVVSLGAQAKSYCFFHLISHACFKSLLFLCVGTWIHTSYGTQEFRSFIKIESMTYTLFFCVANLSLMGFPFTSGFYRKDIILEALYGGVESWAVVLFLLGIGLTCSYSFKMITFSVRKSAGIILYSIGGFGWSIKLPLLIIGCIRIKTQIMHVRGYGRRNYE